MVNNVTGDTSNEAPPPLHPQGMYEGLTTAYNVVSEVRVVYVVLCWCVCSLKHCGSSLVLCGMYIGCHRHCQ